MTFEKKLAKYAKLIINMGIKVKEGDMVSISGEVVNYEFLRYIAEEAYAAGAKDVKIQYNDQKFTKLKYQKSPLEVLTTVPDYVIDEQLYLLDNKAKYVKVIGTDPNGLKGVDSDKLQKTILARSKALKEVNKRMMNSETSWIVVGAPTVEWAKSVYPELSDDEAVEKLWDAIFKTARVDLEEPEKAWEEHINNLKKWSNFLNENEFEMLHFKSKKGTDLKVKLPKGYIFAGASEYAKTGEEFVANIPTEEVFSLPHREGVDGIVYSTKPLNYNGNLIDEFYLKFENGKVIDFDAKEGYETLKNLLETDEGASRIGEVALVPYDSPISNSGILFFETLYDENAACHLALGKAYPTSIKNGDIMSDEELINAGANDSLVHVDFMIGDATTEITAYKGDKSVQIFKDGNFVI
ncbi:MAG: aminopeptidase [Peptoniphilus sp.]|uniref:aminopeptidase n=1 Tax=Peptoniphilus sp. TaxID=1971214 RepID=UPI002A74B422|nr:aminopeptidase [Peptoniphilus sp.]MDY2987335.1 aminopeptidase [Peptoniphilus sp.]